MPGHYRPADRAKPRPYVAPSRRTLLATALVRAAGPLYARAALKLDSIEFKNPERLVAAFKDFQEGRSRLILAFRHPYGDEPQLLSLVFDLLLGREARKLGLRLPRRPHAFFLHDYAVPLWSGALTRWILPRTGALPVYHVKFDGAGLKRIRGVLREGDCPIALAPEGQISYRAETLPRIESGTARLAFWCAEELERAGRSLPVVVLPISVHYRFEENGVGDVEALVAKVEKACGMARPSAAEPRAARSLSARPRDRKERRRALKDRLVALDLALLAHAESYYGISPSDGRLGRNQRHAALLEAALAKGEGIFGLRPEGDRIARVYRIRQEAWDRIYPEKDPDSLSPLGRLLADRRAGEAWYAMRHMELVDLGHYLDSGYLEGRSGDGDPSFGRLVESAYSLADLAQRLVGGDIGTRPSILRKKASVFIGEGLDLGARLPHYRKDSRAAIEGAMADLSRIFLNSIEEFPDD
ncbi:MAG TPA: hypothetical protein VMV90_14960 [Rectinemataceae bacterium]|nr:hypothetical protein [Rectinemataceae bacterium]